MIRHTSHLSFVSPKPTHSVILSGIFVVNLRTLQILNRKQLSPAEFFQTSPNESCRYLGSITHLHRLLLINRSGRDGRLS